MKPDRSGSDTSSLFESSSTSSVKVRSCRRNNTPLPQVNPVGAQRNMGREPGRSDFESAGQGIAMAPPLPSRTPPIEGATPTTRGKANPVPACRLSVVDVPTPGEHSSFEGRSIEDVIDSLGNTQRPAPSLFLSAGSPLNSGPFQPFLGLAYGAGTSYNTASCAAASEAPDCPNPGPKKISASLSKSWSNIARYSLTALPCAAIPLLGATLLAYFAVRSSLYVSDVTDSPTAMEEDAALVFSGVACREVAAFLALIADHSVQPCEDFYLHVCGKWANGTTSSRSEAESSRHLSYEELNRRSFLARVHRTFAYLAYSPQLCSPRDRSMVRFHDSFVHFASRQAELQGRPSVQTVLEEAAINASSWLRAATLTELLENAVGSCLETGLMTALSVRRSEKGDIFVDVGESLVHTLQDDQP